MVQSQVPGLRNCQCWGNGERASGGGKGSCGGVQGGRTKNVRSYLCPEQVNTPLWVCLSINWRDELDLWFLAGNIRKTHIPGRSPTFWITHSMSLGKRNLHFDKLLGWWQCSLGSRTNIWKLINMLVNILTFSGNSPWFFVEKNSNIQPREGLKSIGWIRVGWHRKAFHLILSPIKSLNSDLKSQKGDPIQLCSLCTAQRYPPKIISKGQEPAHIPVV